MESNRVVRLRQADASSFKATILFLPLPATSVRLHPRRSIRQFGNLVRTDAGMPERVFGCGRDSAMLEPMVGAGQRCTPGGR